MRKVRLATLRQHPSAALAAGAENPSFVGVFRLTRAGDARDRARHSRAAPPALAVALAAVVRRGGRRTPQRRRAADTDPAFSLSTSQVFTTRDAPHFYLTFRHLPSLDVRVYKVRDPFAFFGGLRDLHQMGTDGPRRRAAGAQLHRAARRLETAAARRRCAAFVRGQFSREYRAARTAASDRTQTAQRVRLNVNTFAQVPLLNPDQLVTSWRELLPDHRDPEVRRVPLEVKEPGAYVVEARDRTAARLHDRRSCRTSAWSPRRRPARWCCSRPTASPASRSAAARSACWRRRSRSRRGTTTADGTFEAALPETRERRILGLARCGDQMAATDPGTYGLSQPARELVGYVYTDKPIYRPGHTVHAKAVLRWRERDALLPFDRPERRARRRATSTTRWCSGAR